MIDKVLRAPLPAMLGNELLVIPNAFIAGFANRAYYTLSNVKDWKQYDLYTSRFAYHHHNIYDEPMFRGLFPQVHEVFDRSKEVIASMTGLDCSGGLQISSSLYLPGDYSLPHTDAEKRRQVAFIWHLSEGWQPEWGGHLFWCNPPQYIAPSFNTLILFRVTPMSHHFVCPVSPYAAGRRFAINGWWTAP